MGEVRNLTQHPAYRADPDFLANKRLSMEDLEREEDTLPVPEKITSICQECVWQLDPRPWYRRWFSRTEAMDLYCGTTSRQRTRNPVTGEAGYLPFGASSPARARPYPFEACLIVNPCGSCSKFQPKVGVPSPASGKP